MNKEWGVKLPEHAKGDSNNAPGVFKNSEKKPLRYSQDSFVKELIGKNIRISLTTQEVFEGVLKELGMYDFLLEVKVSEKITISGKEVFRESRKARIFMKSSVAWVEVL